MTWKDIHSKVSEEKHIAKMVRLGDFFFVKRKKSNWFGHKEASGNMDSKVLMEVVSE